MLTVKQTTTGTETLFWYHPHLPRKQCLLRTLALGVEITYAFKWRCTKAITAYNYCDLTSPLPQLILNIYRKHF